MSGWYVPKTVGLPQPTIRDGIRRMSTRISTGRKAVVAAVAAALVASGAVVVTTLAGPASAVPTFQEAGTLSLSTRSGVTTASLNGSTQSFTTSGQCQLSTSGATLLRYSALVGADAGNVGFQTGTFGVAEKPSGTSCVEVNNNKQTSAETLILKLGTGGPFSLQASAATLDVEVKGTGAKTTVEMWLGGVKKDTDIFDCNSTSSDSGPDAKNGDNCTLGVARDDVTTGYFDELRISASAGAAVSLEGGQDWVGSSTPNVRTTFTVGYLAENPIACSTGSVTVAGSASTPSVTIRNISTSSGTCNQFVYTLTSTGGKATFLKPYSEQSQRLQFMMDLEWQIPAGAFAELPKVFFGFHDKDLVEGAARELGWCTNPVLTSAGVATGLTATPTTDFETDNVRYPGVQYACMATSSIKRDANGTPTHWVQSVYVHGDAYARR